MTFKSSTVDTIFHDVIAAGLIAASIFVKNPQSQERAANIINAINPLIEMIMKQLDAAQQQAQQPVQEQPVQENNLSPLAK